MTSVLVVAANNVVRAGLESILRASAELSIVGSSYSLETLPALIEDYAPDVVLVELGLGNNESLLEKLPALDGEQTIVILTDNLQGDWLAEALRLGIRGLLPRSATAEEIVPTVVAAAAGLVVLHPDVSDTLLPELPVTTRSLDSTAPVQALTPREIEVLGMMAQGLANKAIARCLGISEHTVKFHISSIFTKLNASSRTEAVMLGARQGLLML